MAVEIISYWSGEQLSYVFNAVSAMVNNATFKTILKIVAMAGISFFFVMTVFGKEKQEDFPKYAIATLIFFYFMVGPKESIMITDKALQTPPQIVGNVPKVLADVASLTSKIGSSLTDAAETVFSLPDQLSFSQAGPLFGHRIIQESGNLAIKDPVLSSDVLAFYRECIIPDFNTGYLDIAAVMKSGDIWSTFNDTNPGRYVTIHENTSGKWQWMSGAVTCPQAYNFLTNFLNNDVTENLGQIGRTLNPHANQVLAQSMVVGQIEAGYLTMLGVSANATDIIRQKMMINFMNDASMRIAAADGDMAGMQIGIAQSMAEAQMQTTYGTMRKIAEGALPKIRNAIEAIIYALFPVMIIIAIVLGHKALSAVFMYVKLAIWIQLWPMLYAVFNFFITFTDAKIRIAQFGDLVGNNPMAMAQASLINAGTVSDTYIAGMLLMLIPAIAWMIASGTAIAAAQVAGSLMQPAQSSASSVGGQVGAGNISAGNSRFNTASADAYNMSPQVSTGTMSVSGSDGYQHKFSDLGHFTDGSFNLSSGMKTDVSGSMQKMQSAQQSLSTAQKATQTAQESFNTSISSSAGTSYDFASNASNMQSFTKGMGKDESNEYAKGAQSYQSSADSIAKALGIDSAQAKQLMGSSGFGWNNSWLPGLKAKVEGSAQYSQAQKDAFNQATTGENGKKLDEASRWAEKVNQNSGWSDVAQHGNTASKKIASGVLETRQKASALSAAKSNEASAQQAYTEAVQTAVSANTNMNDTAGIIGERARAQHLRSRPGDYGGAELASQKAAANFLMANGGNPNNYLFGEGSPLTGEQRQQIHSPSSFIGSAHNQNVASVNNAGDPTSLANNAAGLYQGEMTTAQNKVTAGMEKLDKDVAGMKARGEAFRATTGQAIDGKSTEALKAAEASGLISFDEKSGSYTVNKPDMGKNIGQASKEVSDMTGGKVSPEQVEKVVGALAAARTDGILGGKAVESAAKGLGKTAKPSSRGNTKTPKQPSDSDTLPRDIGRMAGGTGAGVAVYNQNTSENKVPDEKK